MSSLISSKAKKSWDGRNLQGIAAVILKLFVSLCRLTRASILSLQNRYAALQGHYTENCGEFQMLGDWREGRGFAL